MNEIQEKILKKVDEKGVRAGINIIHAELAAIYPAMDIREALLNLLKNDVLVVDKNWTLKRT